MCVLSGNATVGLGVKVGGIGVHVGGSEVGVGGILLVIVIRLGSKEIVIALMCIHPK